MIRLLLYFLLGYIVWRIAQVVLRMIRRSSARDFDPMRQHPAQNQSHSSNGFKDVKDARFEDLPPSRPKEDKHAPPN